ncbi:hypothetical protein [Desulfospira joergensenii]|uniref:hypothetical protein n=1 Tax=Desulfospira joergensenii TaxID=53329 RepID=UPI0003B5046A|nr:hypothetical protein [Desulfospira joergensenii]
MKEQETIEKKTPRPPQMSPYVFTFLLLGFGLWCFWDGWLTSDPEMAEHALFNQVLSAVLIPWAIWDFFKVKKKYKK